MAKLLTLEDVAQKRGSPVWLETINGKLYNGWVLVYEIYTGDELNVDKWRNGYRIGLTQPSGHIMWLRSAVYGSRWRCWNIYPTLGETETPWEKGGAGKDGK